MAVVGPFYSHDQLAKVWVEEGGRAAAADVAAAIALAESSGGAGSWSPNPDGHTNWGAWQIDAPAAGDLLTIRGNARAAIARSDNGRNWCAWQTWDGRGCAAGAYNGAYRSHLAGAAPPASVPGSGTAVPTITHGAAPLPGESNESERKWDHSSLVKASARARSGHANVLESAARNVTAKLGRWRLPR